MPYSNASDTDSSISDSNVNEDKPKPPKVITVTRGDEILISPVNNALDQLEEIAHQQAVMGEGEGEDGEYSERPTKTSEGAESTRGTSRTESGKGSANKSITGSEKGSANKSKTGSGKGSAKSSRSDRKASQESVTSSGHDGSIKSEASTKLGSGISKKGGKKGPKTKRVPGESVTDDSDYHDDDDHHHDDHHHHNEDGRKKKKDNRSASQESLVQDSTKASGLMHTNKGKKEKSAPNAKLEGGGVFAGKSGKAWVGGPAKAATHKHPKKPKKNTGHPTLESEEGFDEEESHEVGGTIEEDVDSEEKYDDVADGDRDDGHDNDDHAFDESDNDDGEYKEKEEDKNNVEKELEEDENGLKEEHDAEDGGGERNEDNDEEYGASVRSKEQTEGDQEIDQKKGESVQGEDGLLLHQLESDASSQAMTMDDDQLRNNSMMTMMMASVTIDRRVPPLGGFAAVEDSEAPESAQDYLKRLKVNELFEMLLGALVANQPEKPVDFLHDLAKRINLQNKHIAFVNEGIGVCPCDRLRFPDVTLPDNTAIAKNGTS